MTSLLVAQAAPDLMSPYMATLISMGGFGFLLLLLLTNKIYTKYAYDQRTEERDYYREAFEVERAAHSETQKSRDLSVEQNKLVIHLLEELKSGPKRVEP